MRLGWKDHRVAVAAIDTFYLYTLTLILGKCGEQTGLETRVVSHPQTMGFQSWLFESGL